MRFYISNASKKTLLSDFSFLKLIANDKKSALTLLFFTRIKNECFYDLFAAQS